MDSDPVMRAREVITDLINERERLKGRAQEIQLELQQLTQKVRTQRLPDEEYRLLCVKQYGLNRQKKMLEQELRVMKGRIRTASDEETRAKRKEQKERELILIADDMIDTPLRSELSLMRQYYMEFAADLTRVSSMRQMAAEFANRLDEIIKASLTKQREAKKLRMNETHDKGHC